VSLAQGTQRTQRKTKGERGLSLKRTIVTTAVSLRLKTIEALEPVHAKQVLTQLRLTALGLGYLINFGEEHLNNGIKRLTNRLVGPDS